MRVSDQSLVHNTSTREENEQRHLVDEAATIGNVQAPPKLIFIGGQSHVTGEPCSSVDVYDVKGGNANDVMRIPPLPGKRLDASVVAKDGCFYVIGGYDGVMSRNTVLKFTPNEMKWSELRGMSFARHSHTSCVVGDYIVVAGGVGNDMKRMASVEAYDIAHDNWIMLPDLPNGPLSDSASCEHNGNFVISGGFGETNRATTTVFSFNTTSKRWLRLPQLLCRRSQHSLASVGGDLYALGDVRNRTIECLDLTVNKFVFIDELPITKCSSSVVVVGDNIVLPGGWDINEPIVTYNVRSHISTTEHVTRNCLSPHVAVFEPKVLSLWVTCRTFIRQNLTENKTEGDTVEDMIQQLPLPGILKEVI